MNGLLKIVSDDNILRFNILGGKLVSSFKCYCATMRIFFIFHIIRTALLTLILLVGHGGMTPLQSAFQTIWCDNQKAFKFKE